MLFLVLIMGTLFFSQQKTWDKDPYYKEGEQRLKREFNRALSYAVDQNYNVVGKMIFTLFIDDSGIARIIDVSPKVKNQQSLIDDLNYVLKKPNKKWEPARKDDRAVKSFFWYTVNFNTEVYDHD
ncbi:MULTISPECIES: hypothetical protein [Chryseobacterium]|uniref:hypothetical protein n=1 Tax=Chryseobacterium sp. R2A-55 TaxID=2744445 RepID=UPI001F3A78D6|nr:hypothetical protein [Chryseobacterium sp. R2A-55]